jgi:hypothetical protein
MLQELIRDRPHPARLLSESVQRELEP